MPGASVWRCGASVSSSSSATIRSSSSSATEPVVAMVSKGQDSHDGNSSDLPSNMELIHKIDGLCVLSPLSSSLARRLQYRRHWSTPIQQRAQLASASVDPLYLRPTCALLRLTNCPPPGSLAFMADSTRLSPHDHVALCAARPAIPMLPPGGRSDSRRLAALVFADRLVGLAGLSLADTLRLSAAGRHRQRRGPTKRP